MKRAGLRGFVAGLILLALGHLAEAAGFQPIVIRTSEIEHFLIGRDEFRFGEFDFRGGLILTSPNRSFGGLSGIDFEPGGQRFLAISDMGYWFRGTIERENGRVAGLSDTEWAPILNANGKPLGSKRKADAESIRLATIDGKPAAYVSFERTNDLRLYRLGSNPSLARPQPVKLPRSATGMVRNRGLETVALSAPDSPLAGAPVLVTERSLDAAGNHRAWIVGGPLAGAFSVVRSGDFDVTDGAFLPNGDLLLLERRILFPLGVGMRLRRIDGASIRPGAVVDGPTAMQADMSHQIDNMEGLAVSRDEDGRTRITLVSDDNLSRLQRTLLLEFIWLGPVESVRN